MLVSLLRSTTTFTAIYRLSASSTGAAPLIGASSICQYKDGSRIHEASVSAKNPSICRTRVLPSSGLCWTVICQPRETSIKSGVSPSINPIPIPFGEPTILSAERRRCMARSIPPNIREPRCPPARQPTCTPAHPRVGLQLLVRIFDYFRHLLKSSSDQALRPAVDNGPCDNVLELDALIVVRLPG